MPFRSVPPKEPEEPQSQKPAALPQPSSEILVAHIDGGARGNPGPAGYGVVLEDGFGRPVCKLGEYIGRRTNNVAEYSGLLAALRYAVEHGCHALKVLSDSELLVRQMNGQYKVKHPALQELYGQAQPLIRKLQRFSIKHVRREENSEADRLANEAMDRGQGIRRAEPEASCRKKSEKQS